MKRTYSMTTCLGRRFLGVRFCTASAENRPTKKYETLVADGTLNHDPRQAAVMVEFDRVWDDLNARNSSPESNDAPEKKSGGFFSKLFKKEDPVEKPQVKSIQGLYVYGGVGCGKTFLMDLFHDCVPHVKRRRTHFHSFMLEVHERLHSMRSSKGEVEVANIAKDIVQEGGEIFCFDEMNVTDIGDAVILRMLFEHMINNNAVLIMTSNRPPSDLYKNGLQRNLFIPCIELLERTCHIHNMDSGTDYRLLSTNESSTYIHPHDSEAEKQLDAFFKKFSKQLTVKPLNLITQGRKVPVLKSAAGIADFHFRDLCDQNVGTADYYALSKAFHTIIIRDIPQLTLQELPQVRRLINLVDVMYDNKVKVICSAASDPFSLFVPPEGSANVEDVAFAFDRTASRLQDMQSTEYKSQMHIPPGVGDKTMIFADLSDDRIDEVWAKYDTDNNGTLERNEIRVFLQDIRFEKMGHRDVDEVEVNEAMSMMDSDLNGSVDKDEFKKYFENVGVGMWYV